MKICTSCGCRFEASDWRCPSCLASPDLLEGFPAFAPDLAVSNGGFKAAHFDSLARLEDSYFWFRVRNQIIIWALDKYFPGITNFLEIGCGTGFVLSSIERAFTELHLHGSEIFSTGLNYANSRVDRCSFYQMDARNIPFEKEFDVIGAFDVLEHIIEDKQVLSEMYRAVRPGGGIILTVPQHAFLWSQVDERACHVRRYSANDLRQKVQQAGFYVARMTSFVSLLLPLMMLSRLRHRDSNIEHDPLAEYNTGNLANFVLEKVLDLDRLLIRMGLSLPAGGSLLLVARRIT